MYVVANEFIDKTQNDMHYKVGEEYPKGHYKPTKKRIEELSTIHPEYKKIFIQEVEVADSKE